MSMSSRVALISAFNKDDGLRDFAANLIALGFEIYGSRGTVEFLKQHGIAAKDVTELVRGEPILGHRVVTLSREIAAGLLARPDNADDMAELACLGIPLIELVYVDFYPLESEIRKAGSTSASVIEMTDIGGPTLAREAAKGRRIVVCDPVDRVRVIEWLTTGCPNKDEFLRQLAAKAEATVARYCLTSATYHGQGEYAGVIGDSSTRHTLVKGENGWEQSTLYVTDPDDPLAIDQFNIIAGQETEGHMAVCDADRGLQTITHLAAGFEVNFGHVPFLAVGLKHGNPCGAAAGDDQAEVIRAMFAGHPEAIFGGVIITNFPISKEPARLIRFLDADRPEPKKKRIIDGVIAPDVTDEAVGLLARETGRCRILVNPALANLGLSSLDQHPRFRYVRGGFLWQDNYTLVLNLRKNPHMRIHGEPLTVDAIRDLVLAWATGSTSNSNSVTLANNGMLIGNGMGDTARVTAAKQAMEDARRFGHPLRGAVAYSDSFFPFPDGVQALNGISWLLASSGSQNDDQIVRECERLGINLVMIPDSQIRGFYGH